MQGEKLLLDKHIIILYNEDIRNKATNEDTMDKLQSRAIAEKLVSKTGFYYQSEVKAMTDKEVYSIAHRIMEVKEAEYTPPTLLIILLVITICCCFLSAL